MPSTLSEQAPPKPCLICMLAICICGVLPRSSLCLGEELAKDSETGLVFADDFKRKELGAELRSTIPDFRIEDGLLKGRQIKSDHGAACHREVKLPNGNVRVELRFRFEGAKSFNLSCDDRGCKKVHAGHIARIVVQPKQLTLYDDKEGVMRLDIRELRKSGDPAKKAEGDRMSADATARFPLALNQHQWYRLQFEIAGERMRVLIDDKQVGELTSPGLAHPTKPDLRLGVWGNDPKLEVHFDELRVSSLSK